MESTQDKSDRGSFTFVFSEDTLKSPMNHMCFKESQECPKL